MIAFTLLNLSISIASAIALTLRPSSSLLQLPPQNATTSLQPVNISSSSWGPPLPSTHPFGWGIVIELTSFYRSHYISEEDALGNLTRAEEKARESMPEPFIWSSYEDNDYPISFNLWILNSHGFSAKEVAGIFYLLWELTLRYGAATLIAGTMIRVVDDNLQKVNVEVGEFTLEFRG